MYLKKENNIFRTVTFRITLWYIVLLTSLLLTIFILLSLVISSKLIKRVDEELLENAIDIEQQYQTGNINILQTYYSQEAEEEGANNVFFLFLGSNLDVLASSNLSPWKGFDFKLKDLEDISIGEIRLKTHIIPKTRHKVRVISKKTSDGNIIQIGFSLKDDEELIKSYRDIFLITIAVIITIGSILGWLITRRAMSGVVRVTKAAIAIGKGNFSFRVPLGNEGIEIQNMVKAFNDMVAKIELLMKELKDVTNNIAHDLRSPLTRIRGIVETTISGNQNIDEFREMAGIVIEECDRLIVMINTMLEIAEMDQGVTEYSNTPIDLIKIVNDAYELFTPVTEDKNISIKVDIPSNPILLFGDAKRIQRVIANLLDNAIKYTPHGGKIVIKVDQNEKYAKVSILDSGIGITEEDIPHIFDRFYRGDRSRTTSGNGLGLSLVLAIVKAHHGTVSVKSTPGKGSTFTTYLPLSLPIKEALNNITKK
jgi:signal transduction histidine kinase